MMGIGFAFANNYHDILFFLDKIKLLLLLLGVLTAAVVVYRYKRDKRSSN
jgi:positive regulator of sigma E activity